MLANTKHVFTSSYTLNTAISHESYEAAKKMVSAMDEAGCSRCTNCVGCTNCSKCIGCIDCTNCIDCKYCTRATDLSAASFVIH